MESVLQSFLAFLVLVRHPRSRWKEPCKHGSACKMVRHRPARRAEPARCWIEPHWSVPFIPVCSVLALSSDRVLVNEA